MSDSTISICLLYPDLLGTYGDGGNATVLAQRLKWRGFDAEVLPIAMGEDVPDSCHLYVMGGGEDQPQTSVTDHLMASRALHRAVDNGAAVFAVCAGMQVLGESFAVAGDKMRDGLGLLDIRTVRGEGEHGVGELSIRPNAAMGTETFSGYENHGGVTHLGADVQPLGTVLQGKGNDDGKRTEGAVWEKVVGTYMHGPALARNAALADRLLFMATGVEMTPIDDKESEALRRERLAASSRPGQSDGRMRKFLGKFGK